MELQEILFSQGFGTRRDCCDLIRSGSFALEGVTLTDPFEEADPEPGANFTVKGEAWRYFPKAVIVMNKPAGYECSTKPIHHPGVLTLLPAPLRARNVQPVGRLDEDTTGLLLLTDDGKFQHWLIHPKHHVPKVYRARLKHPVTEDLVSKLKSGVQLADEKGLTAAKDCVATGEREIEMTLVQGKYHQVKRMVAAAGNRVESLSRIRFGALGLDPALKPGEWAWVESQSLVTGKKA